MAMAGETPLHVHIGGLPRKRHLVHTPVAGFAADTFVHVNAVIEVDEIRKVVDTIPAERAVLAQARPDRLQHVAVSPDLFVAIHTHGGRRNSGEGTDLNGVVAVPAVDTESANMVLMAERNRLIQGDAFVRDVRRIHGSSPAPCNRRNYKNASEYR